MEGPRRTMTSITIINIGDKDWSLHKPLGQERDGPKHAADNPVWEGAGEKVRYLSQFLSHLSGQCGHQEDYSGGRGTVRLSSNANQGKNKNQPTTIFTSPESNSAPVHSNGQSLVGFQHGMFQELSSWPGRCVCVCGGLGNVYPTPSASQ